MTEFKEIELLYKQYFNLENEIKNLIEEENYDDATERVGYRNSLIGRIANARKTAKALSAEEISKLNSFDKTLSEQSKNTINSLKQEQNEIEKIMQTENKKVKINNAYSSQTAQKQGVFLDLTE